MFDFLPAVLRTPLAFVIVLGILVFIHELGHYLAARWRGVHVETFSIGFGSAWASWHDRHGTFWKLAWIPLGGYVKLHGQERAEDVAPEMLAKRRAGQTFTGKSVLSRAIIVAAGPIANFVLAAVLFIALYAVIGRPVAVPVIGEIVAGSPAASAGLLPGDRITAIDDQPVTRFEDIQRIVSAHPSQKMVLHFDRASTPQTAQAVAGAQSVGGKQIGVLGIRGSDGFYEHLSLAQAIPAGFQQTWDVSVQTLGGLWQMLTSKGNSNDFGGPLRIAQISGQVAALGFASLVSFIAVLSVNLALINLFPIPVLDGGHLLFLLAEFLRGRPLPPRAQEYGLRAGFALLAGLFVFATWNDLSHIGLFHWVAGLIG